MLIQHKCCWSQTCILLLVRMVLFFWARVYLAKVPDVQLPHPPTKKTLRHQPQSAFSPSLWMTLILGSLLT